MLSLLLLGFLTGENSTSEEFSVSFDNTSVKDVMTQLSKKLDKNIVIHKGVEANITADLKDVTPYLALDIVCRANDLHWVEEEKLIMIYSRENFILWSSLNTFEPKKYIINYRSCKYIFEKITLQNQNLDPSATDGMALTLFGGKAYFDESDNSITFLESSKNISKLTSLIEKFDTEKRTVFIEAKIINVSSIDRKSLGINWNKLMNKGVSGNFSAEGGLEVRGKRSDSRKLPVIGTIRLDLDAVVDALAIDNHIDILSSPKLTGISGEESSLIVGQQIPYKVAIQNENGSITEDTKFVETGTKLIITPKIFGQSVELKVHPEISSPKTAEVGAAPAVDTSTIDATVYLKEGETAIIGGLIVNRKELLKSGVPGISRIPVLGLLFRKSLRNRETSELTVLLRAKIK